MTEKPIAAARRELDAVKRAELIITEAINALEAATGRKVGAIMLETILPNNSRIAWVSLRSRDIP